jgi:entericidin B
MIAFRRTAILLTTLATLAACETVHGAGQDLQSAGSAVSKEARRVQSDL